MSDQQKKWMESADDSVHNKRMTDVQTIDLVELVYRLLASWKMIAGVTLLLVLVMGLYTLFLATPMYEATSIIYVLNRDDSAINLSDLQLGNALAKDYVKVFDIWEVHEEVISNLGLSYSYKEMEEMLTVTNTSDTRMIDITIASQDPEEAAAIANQYAQVASRFIAETMATDKPSMMSVALVPANPVSPSLVKNVMIGFALGMLLSCGYVTIWMVLDDKYKTAEDIRRYTGLPALAVIPLEKDNGRKNSRRLS